MNSFFPSEGEISKNTFHEILVYILRESINCSLSLEDDFSTRTIFIKNRKIFFTESTNSDENFGKFLIKKEIITKAQLDKASKYMKDDNIRFGKSLVKMGVFNYEKLFHWVEEHLKWIAYSCFDVKKGHYKIDSLNIKMQENIFLDLDIMKFLLNGIRNYKDYLFIMNKMERVEKIYIINSSLIPSIAFKKYEFHIINLIKEYNLIETVIAKSELSTSDTIKILFFLILTGIASENREDYQKTLNDKDTIVNSPRSFSSYQEAMKYYNVKYEMIYKMLSKEIGPIAISILSSSIESVKDNLPHYMKNITLDQNGRIIENKILKKIWYNDFDENLPTFLKGLEEILYAEIFAVKKNLGEVYEKQLFKWMRIAESRNQ